MRLEKQARAIRIHLFEESVCPSLLTTAEESWKATATKMGFSGLAQRLTGSCQL